MSDVKKARRNYSHIDKEVLDLLAREKSLLLTQLEEMLEIPHSTLVKSINRLESKGKVKRDRVMQEGMWHVRVNYVEPYEEIIPVKKKAKKSSGPIWDTMNNLPCFTCPDVSKCTEGIGSGASDEPNPKYCEYLTAWIEAQLKGIPFEPVFSPDFEEIKKKKRRRPDEEEADILLSEEDI